MPHTFHVKSFNSSSGILDGIDKGITKDADLANAIVLCIRESA